LHGKAVLPKLDPEYIDLHTEYLQNSKSPDYSSWDPSIRCHKSPVALALLPAVDVESTRNIPMEDNRFFLRVYFPATKQPDERQPVLV
jgi:hypothetical protein